MSDYATSVAENQAAIGAQYAKMQQAGFAPSGGMNRPSKPLESIAAAAQRVNSATVTVQRFIERFHGNEPELAGQDYSNAATIAAPPPYNDSLDRLHAAIDRLETRLEQLASIG